MMLLSPPRSVSRLICAKTDENLITPFCFTGGDLSVCHVGSVLICLTLFFFVCFPVPVTRQATWATQRGAPLESYEAAGCGSVSGAFAAAVTTPMDVIKTRLMLGAVRNS